MKDMDKIKSFAIVYTEYISIKNNCNSENDIVYGKKFPIFKNFIFKLKDLIVETYNSIITEEFQENKSDILGIEILDHGRYYSIQLVIGSASLYNQIPKQQLDCSPILDMVFDQLVLDIKYQLKLINCKGSVIK